MQPRRQNKCSYRQLFFFPNLGYIDSLRDEQTSCLKLINTATLTLFRSLLLLFPSTVLHFIFCLPEINKLSLL